MYVGIPVTAAAAGLGLPPGAAATGPECGSIKGLQQMMADLGYYTGPIDGALDSDMIGVLQSFAREQGVPFSSGATISSEFCSRVASLWNKRLGLPTTVALPTSRRRFRATTATKEDAGAIDPRMMPCAMQGGQWDNATKTCIFPEVTSGEAPSDEIGPVEMCLDAGGGWLDGQCVWPETGEKMEYDPASRAEIDAVDKGWWEKQDTYVKVGIIGGGVLVVAGIGYAILR